MSIAPRLFVLGETANARGESLERLVAAILDAMEYDDVDVNQRGPGGDELDVRASFTLGGFDSPVSIVCECKAYRGTIDLPAWLKFLGKIFHLRARGSAPAHGLFIALGGVNGAVSGSYRELREHEKTVRLLTGTELLGEVWKAFDINVSPSSVVASVRQKTGSQPRTVDFAYHEGRFHWLVDFGDGVYTFTDVDGDGLSADSCKELSAAAEFLRLGDFKELEQIRVDIESGYLIRKYILTYLLGFPDGEMYEAVRVEILSSAPVRLSREVSEHAVSTAFETLESDDFLVREDGRVCLLPLGEENLGNRVSLLGELLTSFVWTGTLVHDGFARLIDESLLDRVLETQGALELNCNQRKKALRFMLWSPAALLHILTPQPEYNTYVAQGLANNEEFREFLATSLVGALAERFAADYSRGGMKQHYYEEIGIREVETRRTIRVKGERQTLLEFDGTERVGLGQAAPELGGGVLMLRAMPNAPEPWGEAGEDGGAG